MTIDLAQMIYDQVTNLLNSDLKEMTAAGSAGGADVTAGEMVARLEKSSGLVGQFLKFFGKEVGVTSEQYADMIKELKTMPPNTVLIDVHADPKAAADSFTVTSGDKPIAMVDSPAQTDPKALLKAAQKYAELRAH